MHTKSHFISVLRPMPFFYRESENKIARIKISFGTLKSRRQYHYITQALKHPISVLHLLHFLLLPVPKKKDVKLKKIAESNSKQATYIFGNYVDKCLQCTMVLQLLTQENPRLTWGSCPFAAINKPPVRTNGMQYSAAREL